VRTYGHGSRVDPVEVVSVRVVARVPTSGATTYDPLPRIAAQEQVIRTRQAYFGPGHGAVETPVLTRASLIAGERTGPFLVDEYDSTIVVPPGCSATLDRLGNVEVRVYG
jgi:N-methylhydantoinase A